MRACRKVMPGTPLSSYVARYVASLLLCTLMVTRPAAAHIEGTCLLRLADTAEAEKRCQATMESAGQCIGATDALDTATRECRAQLYTPPDIQHAIEHGRERVTAAADSSPYQQSIRRAANAQLALEPNRAHFQSFFGLDKQHYLEMLDDYFDETTCRNAFRGVHGRYRLVGVRPFERLALDPDAPPAVKRINWMFFEALAPDACVGAPRPNEQSPWGERAIVNLPRELLLELAADRQGTKVYLCVTLADCETQLDKLNYTYSQYVDHVGIYHRLQKCSIGSALASGIRFTKAGQQPLRDNDAFCQQGELDTLELNERKFIQELEGGLFEHGRLP